MSLQGHIGELVAKHQALEARIKEELAHPSSDDLKINELKRKKLRIKDELSGLKAAGASGH